MPRGGYAICWGLAAIVALAPLPFGAVGYFWTAALEASILAVALLWVALRRRGGLTPLPWTDPLLMAGAALLAIALIQIVPLPFTLVELLSPQAAALKAGFSPQAPSFTPLSLNPYVTWRSCLRIICWTFAALMVRHNAVDLKGRLVVAGGLVAGGLFQAVYGLFEFVSDRQHIFGYVKKYHTDEATGTFISRNNYAAFLELTLPFALALALLALGRAAGRMETAGLKRRLARATGKESFRSFLFLMAAFLMATALLMSRSRMGLMSMATAMAAGALAAGGGGRQRRLAAVSVAVAGLVVVFASQIDIGPITQRFDRLRYELGGVFGRYQVWRNSLPLLVHYPLFGSGLGTYELAFSPLRTDQVQVKADFAHNDYLEFLVESGLAGAAVLALGAWLVSRSRRRLTMGGRHDEIAQAAGMGLLAFALHSFTDFHLSIPADAFAAAVVIGLFARDPGPAVPAGNSVARAPSALLPASACAAMLVGLGLAAAAPALAQSQAAAMTAEEDDESLPLRALDDAEAIACAGCALDPFNAVRYFEASARARRLLLPDVEAVVRLQTEGELPDTTTRKYLAGRLNDAIGLAEHGLQLSPAMGRAHLELGLLHMGRFALTGLPPEASDDFQKALASFERAMTLQPWRGATHRKIARVTAPLWNACTLDQRAVIARAVRRARETSPRDADIGRIASTLGL